MSDVLDRIKAALAIRVCSRCGVLLLLVAASGTPCYAQQIEFGGKLGLTFTTFGGDADWDSKTGFAVAAVFGYRLSGRVGLFPELSFVRKGASRTSVGFFQDSQTGQIIQVEFRHTVDLDYLRLSLPVALQIPVSQQRVGARAYAGPSLALEVSCRGELKFTEEAISLTGSSLGVVRSESDSGGCEDQADILPVTFFTATTGIDLGLLFGAGIDVRLGPGMISGDIRYDLGLTDIIEGDGSSVKNRSLEILLGYAYAL